MRIYRMTATFGKLNHETLTLETGLNVIHAPNEWGKSTWCAFLAAMLYGVDTRAKTTRTALADKERYAPWSGAPMEGSMDICWNGRDITVQRRTRGRIPMGDFRAYETATGIPVPELTAANCGSVLLGVEQSVFRRSGFIRLSDLPVTADDNLRRRLNALVTTGDDSGDGERLARELRELRNRCRYNRSGLIPQVQAQKQELEEKLRELEALEQHSRKLKQRLGEQKGWLRQLENHRTALLFAAAQEDAARMAEARDARDRAMETLEKLEFVCANLPSREEARKKIGQIQEFREQYSALQAQMQTLPEAPPEPEQAGAFADLSYDRAETMLAEDLRRYELLTRTKPWLIWLLFGGALLVLTALALSEWGMIAAWAAVPALLLMILGLRHRKKWRQEAADLEAKYGSDNPNDWRQLLEEWAISQSGYSQALLQHRAARSELDIRWTQMEVRRASLCALQNPEQVAQTWQQTLNRWEEYDAAREELQRREYRLQVLQTVAKTPIPPEMEDSLLYSPKETEQLIGESMQEQQRLLSRLGQYQGRMEALGEEKELHGQLAKINTRLQKLEDTYEALTIALETLNDAKMELQRRFAPRITKRAQELLGVMTGGRYERLLLGEDTLHNALWRSDGTVDQLYLALRLAVAEELMPRGPLVLDDALARFDEDRMKAALTILKAQANTKQVILFSCQKREQAAME